MATSPSAAASTPPEHAAFQASALALGGVTEGLSVRLDRDGRRFSIVWTSARKSTPPKLVITTPAGPLGQPQEISAAPMPTAPGPFRGVTRPRIRSPAPLTLRFETRVDRTGKSLRLNRETQTGDAAFDAQIYLESDAADDLVLAALASPITRSSVVSCLTLGCTSITLDPQGDLGVELPLPSADLVATAHLAALLDALGAAAESIPALVSNPPVRTLAGILPTLAVVGTLLSWPLYYVVDALWEPIGSDLYISAVMGGIALWILSLPVLFFVLRGRSVSLRAFVTCALALAVGLPLGGTDLLLTLNGLLDSSAPITHQANVTHLRRRTGKSSSQHVTLDSWNPGEKTVELPISLSLYLELSEGDLVSVTTRRGFLGWERVTRIGRVSAPRTSS